MTPTSLLLPAPHHRTGPGCGCGPGPGPARSDRSGPSASDRPGPAGPDQPGPDPVRPALVLVAHGSRDPRTLAEVRRIAAAVRARADVPVHLAHLGLNEPLLPEVLAGLRGPVVLVPLLLGRGYHVRVDLPAALAAAPGVQGVVTAPLGPDPLLAGALAARLAEAGWHAGPGGGQGVVLAAAGSRDPAGARDTEEQARLLGAELNVPVLPGYVAAGGPTVRQAVAELTGRGLQRVAVAGYFTAPGEFAARAAAESPWAASPPLGAHPAVLRLLLRRYAAALPLFTH